MPDESGALKQYTYRETIPKDPAGKQDVVVGLLTCIWDFGFPHNDFTNNLAHHKPDILLWTGDPIYERVGGYGVIESRAPDLIQLALLDFLRKWFLFGSAVRDLTREIPSRRLAFPGDGLHHSQMQSRDAKDDCHRVASMDRSIRARSGTIQRLAHYD